MRRRLMMYCIYAIGIGAAASRVGFHLRRPIRTRVVVLHLRSPLDQFSIFT
jgi:hypothetical protein